MWLGLVMGNSRFHWGWCDRQSLLYRWDTPKLSVSDINQIALEWQQGKTPELFLDHFPLHSQWRSVAIETIPLVIASVLPSLTPGWQIYAQTRILELADLPLNHLYSTFGIDRGLALVGAGYRWGWPVLVIDGGTALTLTGADRDRRLIGGAILPGLGLQIRTLAHQTGALPQITLSQRLPERWSVNTEEAIASGIGYTLLAGLQDFIQDWHNHYPCSPIVFTGGDGEILYTRIKEKSSPLSPYLHFSPDLVFSGMIQLEIIS